ncbi:DUF1801 domain-containing protein [Actinotalea sp. BY-33]|uniref:DUF1801 domain-containing protein n=1 Tax=Actinotalea soli TaxID=2819234 RepID=A0A939LMH3_9CELL|nr:DUF1801 domain-containing protein [Actinotalea soli]MBO1750627.1 DUF1801 domain-containing protein [Actinotalea soli]
MAKAPAMSPSDTPVETVLDGLAEVKRAEAEQLMGLMAAVTGEQPRLWASRIIGYGQYHYRYESGREGDAPLAAFATNQRQHTIYLTAGFAELHATQLARLGKVKHATSCLYVTRLTEVDLDVLRELVELGVQDARRNHHEPSE